jgi:quinolinate synthase
VFTTLSCDAAQTPALPRDLFAAIQDLKRELNAVVLAHYYQEPDIQDVADYLGDSLGLSQQAAQIDTGHRLRWGAFYGRNREDFEPRQTGAAA